MNDSHPEMQPGDRFPHRPPERRGARAHRDLQRGRGGLRVVRRELPEHGRLVTPSRPVTDDHRHHTVRSIFRRGEGVERTGRARGVPDTALPSVDATAPGRHVVEATPSPSAAFLQGSPGRTMRAGRRPAGIRNRGSVKPCSRSSGSSRLMERFRTASGRWRTTGRTENNGVSGSLVTPPVEPRGSPPQ